MRQAFVLLTTICVLLLCAACSKPTPEQQAINTVMESYEALLQGDYETFLNNRAGMNSIPDSYREQLLVSYKQFILQQQQAHQGIVSFQPTRALMDSTLDVIQVFLTVSYADSTKEEIVVPMVENDEGMWKMK